MAQFFSDLWSRIKEESRLYQKGAEKVDEVKKTVEEPIKNATSVLTWTAVAVVIILLLRR